jgi:hypothetical protein
MRSARQAAQLTIKCHSASSLIGRRIRVSRRRRLPGHTSLLMRRKLAQEHNKNKKAVLF